VPGLRRLDVKDRRADALVCSTKCLRGHRHVDSLKSLALDLNMERFKGRRTRRQRNDLAMAVLHMSAESAELIKRAKGLK